MSMTFKEFYNLDDKALLEIFGRFPRQVKPGQNIKDIKNHPNRHALVMLQDQKDEVLDKIRKLEADKGTPKNDPYLTMLRNQLKKIEAKIKDKE